jgi:protein-S-isoprenylcysteine O-methyltransferase Ste14
MSQVYIAIYFICWALLHSLLASVRVKRLAGRRFGQATKRWYRLGFVLTAMATLIPLVLMVLLLPDTALYRVDSPWRWMMMAGQLAALIMLIWTIMSTEPLEFIGIKQLSGYAAPSRSSLTTNGLYRLSRHPMYLSSMLVMWLSSTMSANLLTLYALMSLYFIVGSYHEEMLLVKQFGQAYRNYRKQVPRIFPGLPFPP